MGEREHWAVNYTGNRGFHNNDVLFVGLLFIIFESILKSNFSTINFSLKNVFDYDIHFTDSVLYFMDALQGSQDGFSLFNF